MRRVRRSFLASLGLLAAGLSLASLPAVRAPLHAQEAGRTDPALRLDAYDRHVELRNRSPFGHLTWQFVGPTNVSGRVSDVAVVGPRGASYTMYVASASGGLWKTVNEGTTWFPVFEDAASTAVGAVAVAPSDPDVVWIGTGEGDGYSEARAGTGVYRSTDAGATWEHMGLEDTYTIGRVVIHPTNPDVVYVAAAGALWAPNPERGVYRTTDGGRRWERVLHVDEHTGAIDLVRDPRDPETLYAVTWQRQREKWSHPVHRPHYRGNAVHKTTDGGDSWRDASDGLPALEHRGRMGIDLARSNPDVLYVFVDDYEMVRQPDEGAVDALGRPRDVVRKGATIFRTDDGARSWRQVSEDSEYMQRVPATYGWVFGQIRVDPTDEDKVYLGALRLNVSEDGGRTFRELEGMHADHHGLWIDPDNPDYLVDANDGGVVVSYDGGETWKHFTHNLPIVQFYTVDVSLEEPFRAYGSIQDHGSYRGVVDLSRGRDSIPAVPWEETVGGEASEHEIDPTDPDVVYATGFHGAIRRAHLDRDTVVDIMPEHPGDPGVEGPLRGQWVAPFTLSPHNPRILYHGMNYVFRSLDRGDAWEALGGDLTDADPGRMGDFDFQTVSALAESPLEFGLLYAGTDDGDVWRVREGGAWERIEDGVAGGRFVSRIVPSAHDGETVYMTQNGRRSEDFTPYVWASEDRGEAWRSIAGGIPAAPVNVIVEDSRRAGVLYVGTDLGVYVSLDGGGSWEVMAGGIPTVSVRDLVLHRDEEVLLAATHGRGMWVVDVRAVGR